MRVLASAVAVLALLASCGQSVRTGESVPYPVDDTYRPELVDYLAGTFGQGGCAATFFPPPATLEEAVRESTLVVLAGIEGVEPGRLQYGEVTARTGRPQEIRTVDVRLADVRVVAGAPHPDAPDAVLALPAASARRRTRPTRTG